MHPTPRPIIFVENGIGYGGAIICLRHLVRNLDRSRFEPIVVTGRTGGPYLDIAADCIWHHIPDRHFDVVGIRRRMAGLRWLDRLPGARRLVNQVLARSDDLINFLPFFLRFLVLARRYRPALIHANNEPLCNRGALLAAKVLGIPAVCHVRGEQQGSRMMRWLYSLPDHLIPVSRWISKGVTQQGIPPARCTYVYDGIELDKLNRSADGAAFKRSHGVPPDGFTVGLVGLLIPWKGQRLFLEAGRALLREMPNLYLFVIGGTPEEFQAYENELRGSAAASDFGDRVIFTGHLSDMAGAYNGLDVVVSASTSPEPLGTVVIESLALGRALVAPRHGGAVEMIDDEVTGLLFEPNDAAALAAAIRRLHAEPDLGRRLGEAARSKALSIFSVHEHVRRVQQIYEQVLNPGNSAVTGSSARATE